MNPAIPDGVPNCVAAALRAGGFLPYFALNGTDEIYENILPSCFEKLAPSDTARPGDLGIIYFQLSEFGSLAHMTLFLGDDQVFEKPSANNQDLFRFNSWKAIQAKEASPRFRFEIWRYSAQPGCRLNPLHRFFAEEPADSIWRRLGSAIETRIAMEDWASPLKEISPAELEALLRDTEREFKAWFERLPGGYQPERDYGEMYRFEYLLSLIKTLQRTPMGMPSLGNRSSR